MATSLVQRHPLQRIASPSRGFSAIVHALGLWSFASSFQYLSNFPNIINESFGWHFQFLTIIGLALATITFMFGLLADLSLSPRLFLVKNILSMTSAPLEVLVTLLYWLLRAVCLTLVPRALRKIDRNLVLSDFMELNLIADIGFHVMPTALLVVDLLLLSPPWTITILPATGISAALATAYWFWVELCYKYNGWYPYPIFALLGPTHRGLLFAMSAIVMAASTATLKWLYGRINGYGDGQAPKARPGAVKAN